MEQKMKKFGVNSTLLLTSLSLVACGGGGSEGYYNNEGSNNNTDNSGNESETDTSKVAESLTVTLQDTEGNSIQQAQDATKVQFAVKVLNADKGGIAEQNVVLNISDTDGLGVTSAASKVASGADGIAIFELDIPTIQADSGKVNLTATVDGTTIQQVYTLNIKKASVIVSDYNLSVPQGSVLNLPKGTANLTVQVTDSKGGAKSGQTVELTLPQEMNGKFVISSGSAISTDAEGKAVFAITANANLTTTEIADFVNSSQQLSFKLIDENNAEKTEAAAITFKDISTVVNTLEIIKPDDAIVAKGGQQTIKVYAKNSNGDFVANKKVQLRTNSAGYGVKLDSAEKQTNAQGYAEFTLKSDSDYPIALSQRGILLTANYVDGNEQISGNATVQVVTSDDTVDDQELVQRLEIASSYKVNANADSVTISVKGVNFKGVGASQGKLTLALNDAATANGVTFAGSATQDFAKATNGVLTYTLKTNAKTPAAVEALVDAGIEATFTTDNGEEETIKITVADEEVSSEAVQYLMIDPINESFDPTQDQEIELKVKAVGDQGSALVGEKVSIRTALSASQLTTLNLSLEGQSEKLTDVNGYATFKYQYKYNKSSAQQELAKNGVTFTTTALSSAKTQSIKANFQTPVDTSKVVLDYFAVDTEGTAVIALNTEKEILVKVKAMGVDGKVLQGQDIAIGIDDTAIANGISYASATNIASNAQGEVTFKLSVKARNESELNALLENGVTVAVVSNRADGSKYSATRKIELTSTGTSTGTEESKVDYLLADPLLTAFDYTTDQTISVRFKALDANGSPLANEAVTIKPTLTNQQLADLNLSLVNSATQTTDAQGYVTFTYSYKYANTTTQETLAKRGVTLVAKSANGNERSLKLNFKAPTAVNVVDLDYFTVNTAGQAQIKSGDDSTISVKVLAKGTDGKVLANQKISIGIDDTAIQNGISYDSATTLTTDAGGNVEFKLTASPENQKELDNLIANGLTVSVKAIRPDGSEYTALRTIELVEKTEQQQSLVDYLIVDPISVFDYTKDQTITVKVKALGEDGGVLANEQLSIASTLSSEDLTKLNLSLNGAADSYTDAEGYASFEFSYKYDAASTVQKDIALAGVPLTITATNGKEQVATINFASATSNTLDYLVLDMIGSATVDTNTDTPVAVKVTATDTNGELLVGQKVEIEVATVNGVNLTTPSSLITLADDSDTAEENEAGTATFGLNINPKNAEELEALVTDGVVVTVKSTLADGSVRQSVRKLEVQKFEAPTVSKVDSLLIDPILTAFDYTQDHSITVKVKALDENGGALANEKVDITTNVQDKLADLNFSLTGASSQMTDASGYATFVYEYKYSGEAIQRDILDGVEITAEANGTSQTLNLNFKASQASESLDYIRLDTTTGSVTVQKDVETGINLTLTAFNIGGQALEGQGVSISIDDVAGENGFYLDGVNQETITQTTDTNGNITFRLTGTPRNDLEVQNLLEQGYVQLNITATRADGSTYTALRRVQLNAYSEEAVSKVAQLNIDPINQSFDYTQDQTVLVKVKALDATGGVLANEKIAVNAADFVKYNFTLANPSEQFTDADGYATFTFSYKYDAKNTEQPTLVGDSIRVIATANKSTVSQGVDVNFAAPIVSQVLDYLSLSSSSYAEIIATNDTKTITITVDAKDTDGNDLAGQAVSIGLNEASLSNGVSLITPSTIVTNANGQVTFQIQVDPKTASELENLDANDLTVSVVANRPDGSQYTAVRKIELAKQSVVYADLAGLDISYSQTTISTLGGETRVKVVAKDASGNVIANTPLEIALSSLTSSRASLSDEPVTTNSKGEAEFTVTVSEGEYDQSLIKNGITFAVVGTNLNNGDRLQQTGNITVTVPANALNPRLTADTKVVRAGETVQVFAAVKDELGINKGGTPMRLALDDTSKALGITLSNDTVMVSDSQNVAVDLVIPKGITTAQLSQITVSGSIVNPNGTTVPTTLVFTVEDAVNPYHLSIDSNRVSLSSDGDTALVTVKLLDANEGGVANQTVNLAINDPRSSTSINGASELTTNEFGEAVFEVSMKKLTGTLTAPIAPITVTAKQTTANGATTTQTSQIQVHTPTALAPQLDLKIKASKDKLNVRGDAVEVSVLVTDMDGSSQAGKAVTLTIPQYRDNGAYIRGASTLESDENGWVKFTVVLDEALQTAGYDFVNQDLTVQAVVKDDQNTERRQSFVMDVVPSEVPNAIGSIAVSLNPTTTGSTDNGVYYTKEGSVQVVDVDGKPIANQDIVMDIRPTRYVVGSWIYAIAKDPWDRTQNPVELKGEFPFEDLKDWVGPNADFFPLSGITPSLNPVQNFATTCTIDSATTTWTANGQALRVVRFIGDSDSNPYTASYRTDELGRFDFKVEYPKANAHWVTVEIGAKASLAQTPIRGYTSFTLSAVSSDYASDGSYAPNQVSPYTTCTN